jgi:hypothetical protein
MSSAFCWRLVEVSQALIHSKEVFIMVNVPLLMKFDFEILTRRAMTDSPII